MDVFDAAWEGDFERVRALVEQNATLVHAADNIGATPLLLASANGRVEVARYLLDQGATVNHRNHFGNTALHYACSTSHTQVVLLLLQRGADATAVNQFGETLLDEAGRVGGHDVVRVLLEHGGSDVAAADYRGWTVCHWACKRGRPDVLSQLVEAGADPTMRDADGCTAGDLATGNAHQACVTILQVWDRAYMLQRARRLRNAASTFVTDASQQESS